MDTSSVFSLLMKHDNKLPVTNKDILDALIKWEKILSFKLVVYSINGTTCRPFTPGKSKSEVPVLLHDGKLCKLHKKEKLAIPSCLKNFVLNHLPTYIDSAFTAHLMTENREYLISNDSQIAPIDFENSGVIEANKKWGGGLQQMLEMKHHLQISPMSVITNFISHIGFFQRYKEGTLFGLSGTIGEDSEFEVIKKLYKFQPCRVPTFRKRLLYERNPIFIHSEQKDWLNKIHSVLKEVVSPQSDTAPGAAALVLCEDICTAEVIHEHMKMKGCKPILYTRNDLEGSTLLDDIPRVSGDIIIATNLAGRGTDIKLSDGVLRSGGLFCLLTFLPRNRRVELQAFGRTARQGHPGSVQLILRATEDQLEISAIRKTREQSETERLHKMIESDVQQVLLREELFHKHCTFLKRLYAMLDKREDKQMIIDTMNENWGQWLQTKQQDIMSNRRVYLLRELESAHRRWSPRNLDSLLENLQDCNFHHLVEFGNKQLFKREGELNNKKCVIKSSPYYDKAIELEPKFTMVAYYNRACSKLSVPSGDYKNHGIADLKKAKELLQVYKDEVSTVTQCALISARTSDKPEDENQLQKQMEVRMQILQYFENQIEETVQKIKDKYKDDDVEVVPTSILEFIPEADIATNEELYSLKLLGLEAAFSVKKKKKFCWLAFGVFVLGIGQIVVGVLLAVLTVGTLSSVGMGLIAEGVSDCLEGAYGMITGEFDMKDWAISKGCSIGLSLACGAAGKFIAKGAKAAYQGAKLAYKSAKGVKSGAKIVAKGIKSTAKTAKTATKTGAKAAVKEMKVMGEVAKGTWGSALKANLGEAGKLVGKELLSQGAMFALNKVEGKAIEKIFDLVGKGFAKLIQESLETSFLSSSEKDLGQFVSYQYRSQRESKIIEVEIKSFFTSVTDDVVQSWTSKNKGVFVTMCEAFRDNILPGVSEHLKGKAALIEGLFEVALVTKSVRDTVKELAELSGDFKPKMVKQCNKKLPKCRPVTTTELEHVKNLKLKLAEQSADKFGDIVSTVLQQNLTWVLNRGLSLSINKVAGKYVNEKLDLEGTKEQVTAIGHSNYVSYMPPRTSEHVDVQHMKSVSEKVRNPETTGTLAELKVAVEKLNCKVVIEDHDGNRVRSLESYSGAAENTVTLVHIPKCDQYPNGHYNVKINGEIKSVKSEGNSCMFEALAIGLKKDGAAQHDAQSVRNIVADEIAKNPEKWHDHFERKEKLENIKRGHLHLLEGGANDGENVNELTAVTTGTYVNILENNQNYIKYHQQNGLYLQCLIVFDRNPIGQERHPNKPQLSGQDTFTRVTNDVNMVSMTVVAENCSFSRNTGRCLYTLPSFKQIAFPNRTLDKSAPVSFHLIPSEAGANAGEHFGNSVVASEHYNQLERITCEKIYNLVKNRDYTCRVDVTFENLIPPGGMSQFIATRKSEIRRKKLDRGDIPNENIQILQNRFEKIGKLGSNEANNNYGAIPQVQRIKSLVYTITLDNREYKFPMGPDTELYVHSAITVPNRKYDNRDLVTAYPKVKQLFLGLNPEL